MSLLVFYNALLSTLGKHLGIIGTLTNTTALWCHLVCENELSLLERKVRVGAQPGGMYWVDGQFLFQTCLRLLWQKNWLVFLPSNNSQGIIHRMREKTSEEGDEPETIFNVNFLKKNLFYWLIKSGQNKKDQNFFQLQHFLNTFYSWQLS